ncbi:hypothetical protein [Micromonospora sp. DT47]|uniref:hypothetical protein n=1 Tax=Micromonospora sp. DT47 TaxID=3393431 RepID=UPI003CF3EE49
MIVVQVLRVDAAADGADAALFGQELVELLLPHPVTPPQVVLARPAVESLRVSLPRALWQGLQQLCRPLALVAVLGKSSAGFICSQSGHHFRPPATGVGDFR